MTTTIRVSDPIDLVKVLPYQLGFHPADSLALLGIRDRHLGLVQRADLPTGPEELAGLVEVMAANLDRDGCPAAVVIVYESQPDVGAQAGRELVRRLRTGGVAVTDHLVVRDGLVYFPESPAACRDGGGVPLPRDCDVPAVADFVALGANPSPSRVALSARVDADDGPVARRVKAAADRLDRLVPRTLTVRAMADWGRLLDVTNPGFGGAPTSAAAAARMAVSLLDVQLRDLITAWLCPDTLPPSAFDPWLVALARTRLPAGRHDDADMPPGTDRPAAVPTGTAGQRAGVDACGPEGQPRDLPTTMPQPEAVTAGPHLTAVPQAAHGDDGPPPAFESRSHPLRRTAGPEWHRSAVDAGGPHDLDDVDPIEASALVVDRLCWLARHTPQDLAPGVLTVLASYAWWLGDGALASVALDRALTINPAYRLAQLVEKMVHMAIRPQFSA